MLSKKDFAPARAPESIPISENFFSSASKSGCPSFGKKPKPILINSPSAYDQKITDIDRTIMPPIFFPAD
jgi:hypothetical protein